MTPNNEDFIPKTKEWIENFIIGHNICPFAAQPFTSGKIKFKVIHSSNVELWLKESVSYCNMLIKENPIETSNAFLIFPELKNSFSDFLDWQQLLEFHLEDDDIDAQIQIVGFHPNYQFDETDVDDAANKTNQSPFPMIHLLRVDEVSKAIDTYGNTEEITERNINYLRKLDPK